MICAMGFKPAKVGERVGMLLDDAEREHHRRTVEEHQREDLPDVSEVPEEDEQRRQQHREPEDEHDELEVVERREQASPA